MDGYRRIINASWQLEEELGNIADKIQRCQKPKQRAIADLAKLLSSYKVVINYMIRRVWLWFDFV